MRTRLCVKFYILCNEVSRYGREGSGGAPISGYNGPEKYAAERTGLSLGGDALHGVQYAGRAAKGSDDQPDQEALRRAGHDPGDFFSAPVFDELEQEIK